MDIHQKEVYTKLLNLMVETDNKVHHSAITIIRYEADPGGPILFGKKTALRARFKRKSGMKKPSQATD